MNTTLRLVTAATGVLSLGATSAKPPAGHVNFVACPIARDTRTVPCWLSQYDGQLYYLGVQVDAAAEFYPPYLGHKALVEGVVSHEPNICGGVVLKPVKVSPLPELDPSCNTLLPAEDSYQVPFAPRGPGPREHRQGGPPPGGAAPETAAPRRAPKTFVAYYDFDSELATRSIGAMQQAMTYAKAINASHVKVTGYRASSLLSDGSRFEEKSYLPEHRAERLAETLKQIGVPAAALSVTWVTKAEPGDGAADDKLRRSTIVVTP